MRGLRGLGIHGLAHPTLSAACLGGLNPWNFDPTLVSMTASMAKRLTGVFAASPIVQGKRDGTGTPDNLTVARASSTVAGLYFYPTLDSTQGSITFRWTPEKTTGASFAECYAFYFGVARLYYWHGSTVWRAYIGGQSYDVSASVTAGTAYNICLRWDTKYTLDGTNYACLSINDTHSFGITTAPAVAAVDSTSYIGSGGANYAADALIEGLTVYRRVLYDGTYGVNVGNGDEIALIAAGVDPTTVTGSWDVVFCLPTNASAGALTTGTGNAWSHPHSSNLLTRGFLNDKYYGGTNQWGVNFNGTSSYINCGSGATLDDLGAGGATFQVEGWYKLSESYSGNNALFSKSSLFNSGWGIIEQGTNFTFVVPLATTNANVSMPKAVNYGWSHYVCHYNDTTKVARVAINGIWGAESTGAGAYVSDAGYSLVLGRDANTENWYFKGSMGWQRIHNHAHYTPGTNFIPPRTFPGTDAGTVEAWALNEGTGTTATASVTTPGNNGTIVNGTWEQQWFDEGSPVMLQSVIGSSTYRANVGSGATIDDLADNAFTVDGWWMIPAIAASRIICQKRNLAGNTGWYIRLDTSGRLSAAVVCATTNATSVATSSWLDDRLWHYVKMTFDDAGDRKIRIYVDNAEVGYNSQTAGVGAIVSDAGDDGLISNDLTLLSGIQGNHGWIRWSNVVRGAGMIPRSNPPAVDGNTVAQWNATDGAGSTLTDSSGNANHGTMAGTYSWNNSPAMEVDSPGARQYGWGYVIGSDAANEGTKQLYSGLTAGSNYVLNAWAYSEDGVAQPCVVIYDETNGAEITRLAGTTTSAEKSPDRLNFSFEIPTIARNGVAADCTSISIKLINLTATGVVGWQQVELLTNLLDNPSLDTGAVADPWIPYGWTNIDLDAGDAQQETTIKHSGGSSIRFNTTASEEFIRQAITPGGIGKFVGACFWHYDTVSEIKISLGSTSSSYGASLQARTQGAINPVSSSEWKLNGCVFRSISNPFNSFVYLQPTAAGLRYVDDVSWILLDDVTLTCLPASAANSVESSGIRVDGYDKAPQVIPENSIFANQGWIKFAWIPRHSAADVAKFGNATPAIAQIYGDADDYITLDWSAANTIRLRYNANGSGVQTGTWNATGAIVAGTTYQMEIKYLPTGMELIVDGTSRITISAAVLFGTVPTSFYPGSLQDGSSQVDAVFLASS